MNLPLVTDLAAYAASLVVLGWVGLLFYRKIKAHCSVPMHFNFNGQPERYGSPRLTAFMMPLLYATIGAVVLCVSSFEQLDAAKVTQTRQGAMAIGPVFIAMQLVIIAITLRSLGRSGR